MLVAVVTSKMQGKRQGEAPSYQLMKNRLALSSKSRGTTIFVRGWWRRKMLQQLWKAFLLVVKKLNPLRLLHG